MGRGDQKPAPEASDTCLGIGPQAPGLALWFGGKRCGAAGIGAIKPVRRDLIRRQVVLVISSNALNLFANVAFKSKIGGVSDGSTRAGWACVFFAQQSVENRSKGLWEGRFFIAPRWSIDNVRTATEGGIPVSRCPD